MTEPSIASESKWEKERKAREAAMLSRLKKLPKENDIVKIAIKRKAADTRGQDVWKQFEIVDELVSAARKKVTDGDSFDEAIMELGEALCSLVDNGKKKADDDSDE